VLAKIGGSLAIVPLKAFQFQCAFLENALQFVK
jgi:hypothetical protein